MFNCADVLVFFECGGKDHGKLIKKSQNELSKNEVEKKLVLV